jgi:hypothetical protein
VSAAWICLECRIQLVHLRPLELLLRLWHVPVLPKAVQEFLCLLARHTGLSFLRWQEASAEAASLRIGQTMR